MINEEKVFFTPGQLVQIKHSLDFSPIMYVVEKITKNYLNKHTNETEKLFVGIKCRWFDVNMQLQEAIFSSKDLKLI